MNTKTKPIYIQVPEHEYKKFKIFSASVGITMQMLMRNSANYFIEQVGKEKINKDQQGG